MTAPTTPSNHLRKPNPITGWIDRHKRLVVVLAIGGVAGMVGLGALTGTKPKPKAEPRALTVCETVAEWPGATRGDLIDFAMDANPSMTRRHAQDIVDASGCAPK